VGTKAKLDLYFIIVIPNTKNQVNISKNSEIKWRQLNIWPKLKVQGA